LGGSVNPVQIETCKNLMYFPLDGYKMYLCCNWNFAATQSINVLLSDMRGG